MTGHLPPKKELWKRNKNLRAMARLFDQLTMEENIMKLRLGDDGKERVLLLPRTYRKTILSMLHDDKTAGHLGATRTLEKVAVRFFWPGMNNRDVQNYTTFKIYGAQG